MKQEDQSLQKDTTKNDPCKNIDCINLLIDCKDCEVNKEFKKKYGMSINEFYSR